MTIDLATITLAEGAHSSPESGMCLLEAVAYVAGEEFSDHPACVSPILGSFGLSLNDTLPHAKRQQLVPLIPKLIGTADDGHDQERGLMAVDWLIRTYTPVWLRLAGLDAAAVSLETLPRPATWDDVEAALPAVQSAKKQAAARDAARDAAWSAAGSAARDAAWDAAGSAARDAAWDAAAYAAWDAAAYAAGSAAWDAARDAAWDAAGYAAGAAAGYAAGAAARYAAWDALRPTVDQLQDSAINLFARMIEVSA